MNPIAAIPLLLLGIWLAVSAKSHELRGSTDRCVVLYSIFSAILTSAAIAIMIVF